MFWVLLLLLFLLFPIRLSKTFNPKLKMQISKKDFLYFPPNQNKIFREYSYPYIQIFSVFVVIFLIIYISYYLRVLSSELVILKSIAMFFVAQRHMQTFSVKDEWGINMAKDWKKTCVYC